MKKRGFKNICQCPSVWHKLTIEQTVSATKRQKGLIVMYKDDNMTGTCNDSLLRMITEGRGNCSGISGNSCSCENGGCQRDNDGFCPKKDTCRDWGISDYPLASVFAPLQKFDNLYDLDTALDRGTAFIELDLPFMGDTRVKGGCCRG